MPVAAALADPPAARLQLVRDALPADVAPEVWTGTELGSTVSNIVPSGWAALDAELPAGGWPCASLTELLCPQPSVLEWRLTGPALRQLVAQDRQIVVVGPPKEPCLPGLLHEGIDQRHLVWIRADTPAERLWTTEQLIKSGAAGAILAWLPQARQEQIRRLQIQAQSCDGPVFLFRPEAAQHEASAAPLRIAARFGVDWEVHLRILKRRGPAHVGELALPSVPGGLASVLTPRVRQPSRLLAATAPTPAEAPHAVGRAAAPLRRRTAAVH